TLTVPQTLKHHFRFSLFFFYPLCIYSNTGAKTKASVADSCSKPAQTARHHACPAHIRLPCSSFLFFTTITGRPWPKSLCSVLNPSSARPRVRGGVKQDE